jgi:methionine-gamma-lyase
MHMSNSGKMGFNSMAVHGNYHPKSGPVNPPVERSSTYVFESCEDGAQRFASARKEGIYARLFSPSIEALEAKLAMLEHGFGGIATGSGMAAVEAVYFAYLQPESHIVATSSVYGPSRSILEKPTFYSKWGVKTTFLDTANIDAVREAIAKPDTKLLFVETPANPTLAITDLAKAAEVAHKAGIPLAVDNTFCSPFLQNPLDLGADIVLHSMTKSIGGHANAVGGILIAKEEEDYQRLRDTVINRGAVLSPDNADLFNTGVKTLGLRMERMQANAIKLADCLKSNPKVAWMHYPGLEDHPQHHLVGKGKQMAGPGSMLTFGLKGGYDAARNLLNNLHLITLAVSLGGVESLIQHPASMTHAGVPESKRIEAHITNDLIRFSAGIEEVEDLIADFGQAFTKV